MKTKQTLIALITLVFFIPLASLGNTPVEKDHMMKKREYKHKTVTTPNCPAGWVETSASGHAFRCSPPGNPAKHACPDTYMKRQDTGSCSFVCEQIK